MYTYRGRSDGDELHQKKIAHIAPVKINPHPGPSITQSAQEKMTISDMSESERLKKRAERFGVHLNKDFSFQEDLGIDSMRTEAMRKNRKRKAETEYHLFHERDEAERAENILLKVEDRIRRRKEREREQERKKEQIIITVISDKASEHSGLQGQSYRDRDDYRHRDSDWRREEEPYLDYHSSTRSNMDPHLDRYRDRSYGRDSPSTSPVRHLPRYTSSDDWTHRDESDDRLHLAPLDLYRNERSDRIPLDPLGSYTDDRIRLDPIDPYRDQPDDRIYMDPRDSFRDPPGDRISMDPVDPFRDSPHNRIRTGFRDYDDIPDSSPLNKRIRLDPDVFRESVDAQLEVGRDMPTNPPDSRSRVYRMDTNRDQTDINLRPKSSSQYDIIQEDSLSLMPQTSSILSDDQISVGSRHTYRKEAEDRLHRATYRDETELRTFDDMGSRQEPYYQDYQDVRPDYQINPDAAIYTETEIMSRPYNQTEQSTSESVDKDCQVFDYGHGGLESLHDTSRDHSGRIQDYRHRSDRRHDSRDSSDRNRDSIDRSYSMQDRSDRRQDSRDRSDRRPDSREHSDRRQDSRDRSDWRQDSRERSDWRQDSRERSDRKQDFRDHSDRGHNSRDRRQDSRDRLDRRQDSRDRSDRRQDFREYSARIQDSKDRSDRVHSSTPSLDRVHGSARHPSDRLETSRHSSNRIQDHRHHSDIPQDSRYISDRVLDSRSRSDRVQDSRHSSDRVQDSRHSSDRVQDSRHSSDRVQDSPRHHSDRERDSTSRHPHSADHNSVSSTGDNYLSDRLQDRSTHSHGHPVGDDRSNFGSRISRTDQLEDDQLRLDHSEIVYDQRPSVSRPRGAEDYFDLDLQTGQGCSNYERKSGDTFPDRGYAGATYQSNQGFHGVGSSSYNRRSRSPDQRRNMRALPTSKPW